MGVVEAFSTETSLHGINHIFQRKTRVWQFVWVVLSLISFGYAFHGSINILLRFLSNPTSADYQMATHDSISLPNLVFSSRNIMSNAKMDIYNVSSNLRQIFRSYIRIQEVFLPHFLFRDVKQSDLYPEIPVQVWNETRDEYEQLLENIGAEDFDELLVHIGLKCTDFVIRCTLNEIPFDCCTDSFMDISFAYPIFILGTGNQTNSFVGLQALVSVEALGTLDYYTPFPGISTFFTGLTKTELDQSGPAFTARPGKLTAVFLRRWESNAVNNPPKFACNDDENYSRSDCIKSWLITPPTDHSCNCTHLQYSQPGVIKTCDPWEFKACTPGKPEWHVGPCPPRCSRASLARTVEVTEFDPFIVAAGWNMSVADAKQKLRGMAMVSIQYNSMEDVIIEQRFAMPFGVFLSEVGGQIGFFVGASLLSVFHLFIFMIDKIINSFILKLKKSVVFNKDTFENGAK